MRTTEAERELIEKQADVREHRALGLGIRRDFARNYALRQARGEETQLDPVLASHLGLTDSEQTNLKLRKDKP